MRLLLAGLLSAYQTRAINKNDYLKQLMEGEQLPKATMNGFIKSKTNYPFSADYLAKVLALSKEFIWRLADKANVMCESHSKKTISSEHLEAALKDFELVDHLQEMRLLEQSIKEHNQLKRAESQRLQEMIAKDKAEERERRAREEQQQKAVTEREHFDQLDGKEVEVIEDNYEDIVDVDALANDAS